ncbi:HNH endonuclease [Paenibacillus sp. 11B]|uniref:HNH endonuclease n=1 Tax=Paenibacillus sp. 11B TaxID=3060965 RepID=UPI00265071CE|nr:HNH endonuclease [Paenibacillus sp. 11B]MDN8593207.1 HNH endonuclease [Paenibacillus sp. 11B]
MTNDEAAFYSKHYRTEYFLLDREMILGDEDNRVCRFCGLNPTRVQFEKKAHAIPESIGNKHVLTYYECDMCNDFFGKTLENDLGRYSAPLRTLSLIRGKKGIPAHNKKGINVRAKDHMVHIKVDPDSSLVEYDKEAGEITLTLTRLSYIPMAVYKAYVKMALTMMDESDFKDFPMTLDWIKETDHLLKRPQVKLYAYTKFVEGLHVFPVPEVHLLYRQSDAPTYLPYAWLVLCTGNQVIQIMIPYSDKDEGFKNHLEQGNTWRFIPHPELLREGASDRLDWSGTEKIYNEPLQLTLVSGPGQITEEDGYDFSELLLELGFEEDFKKFMANRES